MTERLEVRHADAEGTVLRILGQVERRGYRLLRIAAAAGELMVEVAARDPGRRLDTLAAQLRRLPDVIAVTTPAIEPVTSIAA